MKWTIKEYSEWTTLINLDVTELDISNSGVSTLFYIEGLPNLKILNCSNNDLTSLNGIEKLPKLIELDCSNNNLTSLNGIQKLLNLTKLNCGNNKTTSLNGVEKLPNLTELICFDNQLTSLEPIANLINLTYLYCSFNHLTSLEAIANLINLTYLYCCYNNLTSLNPIEKLNNLAILHCTNNKLTSLNPIANLINLRYLYFCNNNVTSLNPIENLINLTEFDCTNNELTSLNPIRNLRKLRCIKYHNNPIDHIPPNIQRLLNGQRISQNIYADTQSVHNHSIQESVRKSINNILQFKPQINDVTELILTDPILTPETKSLLMEYSACTDIHSTLNITFAELLVYVYNRIQSNANSDEIKKVLNIEMSDSVCKCFTGRMSRLVNSLNGFDPLVEIKIPDAEQIANIIKLTADELADLYTVELHKKLVFARLSELGYTSDIIDLWIQNIE